MAGVAATWKAVAAIVLVSVAGWANAQPVRTSSGTIDEPIEKGIGRGVSPAVMANETAATCSSVVPPVAGKAGHKKVSIGDIVRLRDFGQIDASEADPGGFAVSPNGRYVAIQVRQADPVSNSYCQALLIYDRQDALAHPYLADAGGDFVRRFVTVYGLDNFPTGTPEALTPKWSGDGRWLAFLKRGEGVTRLFVVRPFEGKAVAVSNAQADVTDFAWSTDPALLRYTQSIPLAEAESRITEEGRTGYRLDNRFWFQAELRPFPRNTPKGIERIIDINSVHDDRYGGPAQGSVSKTNMVSLQPPRENFLEAVITDERPVARIGDRVTVCLLSGCSGATAAWKVPRTGDMVFARREGFASAQTAFYRWNFSKGTLVKLLVTDDAIRGCQLQAQLVCARESSLRPRDIVEIDLSTGSVRQLIDLNPEWIALKLGTVTRLRWSNKFGIETFGDLVLPPETRPDERLPLVVVQYSSRGFLRGGTGDEYPIQAIAAKGFAVLSFNRPLDYRAAMNSAGRHVSKQEAVSEWMDRASVHDSLLRGIQLVGANHPIDGSHIAITGFSDGASTATYALIHSRIFSLALLSTCCEDPSVLETAVGPAYLDHIRANEYPLPWEDHKNSWRRVSLAMNADRVCAKIIIQSADRELRLAAASLRELQRYGRDVAVYVFPDEYHVKWQPAHRQAIYNRALKELSSWRHLPEQHCSS